MIESRLNEDLRQIASWASRKRLPLAPEKSTVTLFSADTHQYKYHPQVFLNDTLIPLERNPKILGVTFDPLLTFGPHAREVAGKIGSRAKILQALAGTDWGHSREDICITFKSLAASQINYAAPVYAPNLKPTHIARIQCAQNRCLRIATGSHAAASLSHVHHETSTLTVGSHLNMLARQFYAKTMVSSHPSFDVVQAPSGPRGLRQTLSSKFHISVAPFCRNGSIPRDSIQSVIGDLHTSAVAVAIRDLDACPNRVLGCRPPTVDDSEKALPRCWRATLSQLRSGFCRSLKSYEAVLQNTDASCPDCHLEAHSTAHLFVCPSFPSP